ncbi:MAG: transketolase [SAR86 cluster bacterium]|uniref:Transketolase n=1 Tax=SAR86 cluster bacterium TaxID=2030880 RepID=A0A2A5CJ93_9GAMM|nr:transketolase [Gammaproteobacteria bacterium AH-315-E17]PCJ41790.1 MAG: transketolase [SAR86 cluster bacterium]PCJ43833.1 MAG: transketolase [SAR86 cluster bacterium]
MGKNTEDNNGIDRQASRKASRTDCANAIRALSMDAVQKAKSGHPGAPMGMADIAEVLWHDYLNHNPLNPDWVNRDRFVLSNGHGSMLVYSLLHLTGYELTIDDLKNFRQLHSKTPGHPEYGYTPGVETTTGPLGQGLANGVGMAIAERTLAAQFNRDAMSIVDHYTYVFAGDGCFMEGVSHEVCSLAGTLGLGKLIVFYDDNGISIDGAVEEWFADDTDLRFQSYNWQVLTADGHNPDEIAAAIESAQKNTEQPTLIMCKTVIGKGSPNKQGKESSHGAPLGEEEIVATRAALGWVHPPFDIPDDIYQTWNAHDSGRKNEAAWQSLFMQYEQEYPALAMEFMRRVGGQLHDDFTEQADSFIQASVDKAESIASRKASQNAIAAFGEILPELIGGSADLTGSNLTSWSGSKAISKDLDGNYIYYGVREFGMFAINNGIALHGGFIPYGATFLIFMEYARNAVRMAALMKQQSIMVFTHDSIGQGEDGPTHQAIEQVSSLRLTPNMSVWRPADAVETAVAWKAAILKKDGPTSLILSRQGLPHLARTQAQVNAIAKGAYILCDCESDPDVIVIATGSEVSVSLVAVQQAMEKGLKVRLVSMPSTDLFDAQDDDYKESVLPAAVRKRLAVEAAQQDYWYKYVGLDGVVIGMSTFGESAPGPVVLEHFGFTAENIQRAIESL